MNFVSTFSVVIALGSSAENAINRPDNIHRSFCYGDAWLSFLVSRITSMYVRTPKNL